MINSIKAYAKINLHLEVLHKRPDGYHSICTIMAKVGIHDLLQLDECEVRNSGDVDITIRCIGGKNAYALESVPTHQNLIAKAVHAYCRHAGIGMRVAIAINKEIPAGAGLAGGSTDAAATLLLVNSMCKCFTNSQLQAIAPEIGADVPFCLNGAIALCEGIGEKVTPLTPIALPHNAIIVYNDIHCNTRDAYKALKRSSEPVSSLRDDITLYWEKGDIHSLLKMFRNDFQDSIFQRTPELAMLYENLNTLKPDFLQLTGSGSAIFALFFDEQMAYSAYNSIKDAYSQVFFTKLLMN